MINMVKKVSEKEPNQLDSVIFSISSEWGEVADKEEVAPLNKEKLNLKSSKLKLP
jgi:uncharacterized protein YdcH (DUF465 family)